MEVRERRGGQCDEIVHFFNELQRIFCGAQSTRNRLQVPRFTLTMNRIGMSVTKHNLNLLVRNFQDQLISSSRIQANKKFSSHSLRNLFTEMAFHPQDKFPQLYANKPPDVAITYPWDMCLLNEMPSFIDEFERLNCVSESVELTYWIDILFVDQNAKSIKAELNDTRVIYRSATYHAVFMKHSPLMRGWCVLETAIRTISTSECNQIEPEKIDARSLDNPSFSMLIVVPGMTNIYEDLLESSRDRFDAMKTTVPSDKIHIQKMIVGMFGSKYRFNEIMLSYRNAAIEKYKRAHPIKALERFGAKVQRFGEVSLGQLGLQPQYCIQPSSELEGPDETTDGRDFGAARGVGP